MMQEGYGWQLEKMRELLNGLPDKRAEQLHRCSRGKEMAEELRRLLAVGLQNRCREMRLHIRREGVPDSTNWVEGKFGRIKPRYRCTGGLKTDAGAINFMSVVCDVLA